MGYRITKGRPEDYGDIIDFANYVFSVDFPSLLPKLYKDHQETSEFHHIIKEEHRIKAVVGSFPLELKVCNRNLKVKGVGTVSVHKYSRGAGYMKLLMNKAVEEMENEGCDMAVLGGQRQRYEYWGFTPCGISMKLNFNSSNIKHVHLETNHKYEFIKYDQGSVDDLDKAVKLHDLQIAHAKRPREDFIDISSSWNNELLFIYKNEEFCGYICSSTNREKISEVILINPSEIEEVVVSYIKYFNLENPNIVMHLHNSEEFMKLSRICEGYSINSCCNIYVINYINVIKAFMELKNALSPLCEGVLVLNVKDKGSYKIEVKDGIVTVEETDLPYDLSLSRFEASALLFSHSSFINSFNACVTPLVRLWFPLPLFYPSLDNV